MNPFFRLFLGVMGGGVFALGRFTVALANGEDVHIGAIEIPAVVLWIGGGVLGALFLFFFISWGFSHRAGRHSQEEEKKGNSSRTKEGKS